MRSFPFSYTTALGLAALVTIQKGDGMIRFTTHHQPITIEGNIFIPAAGADITGMQFPSDGAPANVDLQLSALPTSGLFAPGVALRGLLDGWDATIDMVDIGNVSAGTYRAITGTIGSCDEDSRGGVTIAINGPLAQASNPVVEHYSIMGREDLGDDRCKIPILPADIARNAAYVVAASPGVNGLLHVDDAYGRVRTGIAGTVEDYANVYYECTVAGTTAGIAPTYDPTVGNTTVDGSAHFIARNAWLRYARATALNSFQIQLASLPDSRATDGTWYAPLANVYIRSGALSGTKIPVIAWDPIGLIVSLATPISPADIPANTQIEIHAGCDLTQGQCQSRFSNIVNRRGEEFVPPDLTTAMS